MNVFDFDKTIYNGNSIVQFCLWLVRRHPRLWFGLVKISVYTIPYLLRLRNRKWLIERCYIGFMPYINSKREVEEFWRTYGHKRIKKWYLRMKQPTDVISTASPEFFVAPMAKELGVRLQGTLINTKTGRMTSYNRGREKVVRFRKEYTKAKIDKFYSDSHADAPLAGFAKQAFWVDGDKITPWPK